MEAPQKPAAPGTPIQTPPQPGQERQAPLPAPTDQPIAPARTEPTSRS